MTSSATEGIPPFNVSWWSAASGGNFIGNGWNYTACITEPVTYWVRITDSLGNGDTIEMPCTICAPPPINPPAIGASCTTIMTGLPPGVNGACASLVASPTGVVANPLTWHWSTGATTSNIQVCAAGTYCVTLTDNNGSSANTCITINSVDVHCSSGNSPQHKVQVCHKPPGNPANVQNICIDWSGVPAHVAMYRSPNANPNQGHDSGCQIGPCGNAACGSH